ncbi:LptA/OstA family protein [Sphingomonas sp. MG17]|jgi:lipopolysaccharide export system protein LptA|uniref:LptA/OstA family protein n=1 Tax=Sphingomonas tagetis TaxID=2949092 RepID=A0A9X2KNA0_9SPHN|nr:LptA/OstA family protein [Sphingomonas tagetis]MCP3729448.1 LptA/OstA family protein [Sphingomonas tagetis]
MSRPLAIGLFAAITTTATLAGSAMGQSRHDTSAPIDFAAQSIELQDRANRAILSGGVRITQANMTLTAARVTVSYTGQVISGSPSVSRFDASGGVTVSRPDQTARAQYGVYDINRRVITMLGGVTLTQGANTVSGGRLTINLDTGRASIDGSGVGTTRAPDGSVIRSGGRVTGRFTVPKRD